jgi:hypothetical protein
MAKIDLNKLFDELRDRSGNLVFRRRPDGTLIVSGKPQYKGKRRHRGAPAAWWLKSLLRIPFDLQSDRLYSSDTFRDQNCANLSWISPDFCTV